MSQLSDAKMLAKLALQNYIDNCHIEEANWSGWGDQIIPDYAIQNTKNAQEAFKIIFGEKAE